MDTFDSFWEMDSDKKLSRKLNRPRHWRWRRSDDNSSIFFSSKRRAKNYDAILLSNYDSAEKNILNYAYMLKNGAGRYNIFFLFFTQSLLNPPFCVVSWRIHQCFCSSTIRFLHIRHFSSSTNNLAHAQTLSRMNSPSGRMNIGRVNIEFFPGWKKIKQRRISFVLGYISLWFFKTKFRSCIGNFFIFFLNNGLYSLK